MNAEVAERVAEAAEPAEVAWSPFALFTAPQRVDPIADAPPKPDPWDARFIVPF